VRVASRALDITPRPREVVEITDAYGNSVTRVAFEGTTTELRIESRFDLETSGATLAGDADLAVYGERVPAHPSVRAFAEGVMAGSPSIDAFLDRLSHRLHTMIDRGLRLEGAAQAPETTLELRTGACRDLTVLFLASCRSLGIAGRFVSGYQAQARTPDGQSHLHAWAEVHRPGLGWSGWDPMHDVRVGEGHVALCAAPDQAETMPVEGGFYTLPGTAQLDSTLDHSVRIATE
jgi:transglutaminase-like putative cysteine protease